MKIEPHLRERLVNLTKLLRKKDVLELTGLSHASLYRLIKENRFPAPVKLADAMSAWVDVEVQEWIESKIKERNENRISQ